MHSRHLVLAAAALATSLASNAEATTDAEAPDLGTGLGTTSSLALSLSTELPAWLAASFEKIESPQRWKIYPRAPRLVAFKWRDPSGAGTGISRPQPLVSAVPEPAAALLFVVGALLVRGAWLSSGRET